jgi:hypothetical protein
MNGRVLRITFQERRATQSSEEVAAVEITKSMTMTGCTRLRTVPSDAVHTEVMRVSSSLRTTHTVLGYVAAQGTPVSTVAPTAVKANALLPISDVVVFGDNAGIRTWSPPV